MEAFREILPYKRIHQIHTEGMENKAQKSELTRRELLGFALSVTAGLATGSRFFIPVLFAFYTALFSARQRTILLSGVLMLAGVGFRLGFGEVWQLGFAMAFLWLLEKIFSEKLQSIEHRMILGTSLWAVLGGVKLILDGFLWYDFFCLLIALITLAVGSYLFQMAVPSLLCGKRSESREETISMLVLVFFLALAIPCKVHWEGVSPRGLCSLVFLLYISYEKGVGLGAVTGIYLGFINAVGTGESAMIVAGYALCGLLGGIFNRVGKIGTVLAVLLGNALTAFWLNGSTQVLISALDILIAALIAFVFFPKQVGRVFSYILPKPRSELAGNARMDIWMKKVNHTAEGLETVAQILEKREEQEPTQKNLTDKERKTGISEQLRCLKGILQSFGKTAMEEDEEFSELENRILSKLKNKKIAVKTLHVKKSDFGAFSCELLTERVLTDARKQEVCDALRGVLGQPLKNIRMEEAGSDRLYRFTQKERLGVQLGGAVCAKNSSERCGDCTMTAHLEDGQFLISLSDGMGTGKEAFRESYTAVTLFDEMIESGVPYPHALRLVNSILYLKSPEETFATMDIALIDLYTGAADFLKMGAAATFWVHRTEIHVLCATSMPMGLMHKLDMECMHQKLSVGDYLIMVTDGVLDRTPKEKLPEVWFAETIEQAKSSHPQDLAEELLKTVLETDSPHRDDMTVLVARIERPQEEG